jgi:hypothetical protein
VVPKKKRSWTESEDEQLVEAVEDHATTGAVSWVRVSHQIRRQRTPRYVRPGESISRVSIARLTPYSCAH